jgi:hypothetical protein
MKPEVRIIQAQEETVAPAQISSWEAEQLMRKYGYSTQNDVHVEDQPATSGLTFEEMVAQENVRINNERLRQQQVPRPPSFDGRGGLHTETRYSSDEDTGFSFNVQITSDMPIPKY